MDNVMWRNPLFDLVDPLDVLCPDTLHTYFLCVVKHYIAFIIWLARGLNLANAVGPKAAQLDMGPRFLLQDMNRWYERHHIPRDFRIKELTEAMAGTADSPDFTGSAAETRVIGQWALDLVCRYHAHLREGAKLAEGGRAMLQ